MELKPCPFCGSKAEVRRNFQKTKPFTPFVFVRCTMRNAQTRVESAADFDDDDEFWEQDAVYDVKRRWNTRAPATPSDDDSGDLPF